MSRSRIHCLSPNFHTVFAALLQYTVKTGMTGMCDKLKDTLTRLCFEVGEAMLCIKPTQLSSRAQLCLRNGTRSFHQPISQPIVHCEPPVICVCHRRQQSAHHRHAWQAEDPLSGVCSSCSSELQTGLKYNKTWIQITPLPCLHKVFGIQCCMCARRPPTRAALSPQLHAAFM